MLALRFRHFARLVRDLIGFSVLNRVWWLIPVMVVLGLITIFIVVGQAAAPYTLYTVF